MASTALSAEPLIEPYLKTRGAAFLVGSLTIDNPASEDPQVYNTACLACHGAGIGGAPVLGDAGQWAPRIEQGMETLVGHAINGYTGEAGYMPPKGGRLDLSDEEVVSAVEYMVAESQ